MPPSTKGHQAFGLFPNFVGCLVWGDPPKNIYMVDFLLVPFKTTQKQGTRKFDAICLKQLSCPNCRPFNLLVSCFGPLFVQVPQGSRKPFNIIQPTCSVRKFGSTGFESICVNGKTMSIGVPGTLAPGNGPQTPRKTTVITYAFACSWILSMRIIQAGGAGNISATLLACALL